MLKRTFIHLQGVGLRRELAIWRFGITSWEEFLDQGQDRLPQGLFNLGRPQVERSLACLERPGGAALLAEMMPHGEHWRMWPYFSRLVFLDIETGGDPQEWGGVTVVGLYDGHEVQQYVADHNMWLINDALREYDVVCTYAGSSFDLPVLREVFPLMYIPPIHIDLRWLLKRLGLSGGLKRIEKRLGLERPPEVEGMDGYAAITLWQDHLAGDPQALATLLTYNAMDVINLKPLLDYATNRLRENLLARL